MASGARLSDWIVKTSNTLQEGVELFMCQLCHVDLSIVEFDSLTLTNTGGDASRHEEMAALKDASAIPVADLDPNTASRGRDNYTRF